MSDISSLNIPEIQVAPSTPGTTPNRTGIEITVVDATPQVPEKEVEESASSPPLVKIIQT